MGDRTAELQERLREACAEGRPLRPVGGDSKAFHGNPVQAEPLPLAGHAGIVNYAPTELVLSARAGTPLEEVQAVLAGQGQQLPFDPPVFGPGATLGGAVASGLAGPGRPWSGAPRDVLLGVRMLDGRGQLLRFGGEVMKNVAGYDVSRLQAGALGTLGVLLEVSLKVLPRPACEQTLVLELEREQAQARMRELCRQPAPLRGACHHHGRLYLRLAGAGASVRAWRARIGGETLAEHNSFWQRLRDHRLDFFQTERTLWRLSLPPNTPRLACEQHSLPDWAGAQRWVISDTPAERLRAEVTRAGGHAEVFRRGSGEQAPFQALDPGLLALHRRLKERFDPRGILNPGRLFPV